MSFTTRNGLDRRSWLERERWRAAEVALALLRVAVGSIFALHGWAKLNAISGTALSFTQLGLPGAGILVYFAIAGELFGGAGLALGFFTRIAALGPFCTMLVAIFSVHLGHGLFAKNGGFEYPLVLLLVSVLFAFLGARSYSIDALLERGAYTAGRRGLRTTTEQGS